MVGGVSRSVWISWAAEMKAGPQGFANLLILENWQDSPPTF
jgi:hypothetical protein